MYLSTEKINELIAIAAANDGHCDRCLRVIKVYKYQVSKTMAKIMREMAKATKATGERAIDMETLDLTHTERSQLSKMRQHGLIVQPKDDRGVKKPRHWLITTKGWQFLRGEQIPAKVVVFDNQVLGHEGGVTDIRRLLDDPGFYEADPLSTDEAKAYHDVRTPQKMQEHRAEWRGMNVGKLQHGRFYDIKIERLQVGRPVVAHIDYGDEVKVTEYKDIAAFQRSWKINNG
jgi:hypothetical protein